jgi:hypothetical protein
METFVTPANIAKIIIKSITKFTPVVIESISNINDRANNKFCSKIKKLDIENKLLLVCEVISNVTTDETIFVVLLEQLMSDVTKIQIQSVKLDSYLTAHDKKYFKKYRCTKKIDECIRNLEQFVVSINDTIRKMKSVLKLFGPQSNTDNIVTHDVNK